jgi:hypothetical protein
LMADTIEDLVNGKEYYFRVAEVDSSGLEGEKSSAVSAVPGIFSINIENGSEYTNSRSVTIALTAPTGTSLVQLSEDSTFATAHWDAYGSSKGFELSEGDGTKFVYAQFQLNAGGSSVRTVSDDIILDRSAVIDSVTVTGADLAPLPSDTVLAPGNVIHFAVYTSEAGQEASVEIDDLGTVALNDLGVGGDELAGDRTYEADYVIPDETELMNAGVSGQFVDAAGNTATEVLASFRLHVTSPPDASILWGYAVSSLEIQLSWTRALIDDFSRYRLFRSEDSAVFTDSVAVTQITNAVENKYSDSNLAAAKTYAYWVYVDDTHGNSVPSQPVYIRTLQNTYPDTVSITANFTGDSLTAKISWSKAAVAQDFEAYHILRNTSSFTGYNETLVVDFVTSQQTTSFTDRSIPDVGTYYYRVYVVDKQGLKSPSNEASVYIPR